MVGPLRAALSDAAARLSQFDREVQRVRFPTADAEHWRAVVEARSPTDDELADLEADFAQTPAYVEMQIGELASSGRLSLEVLVPNEVKYYERLVGRHEPGQTLQQFMEASFRPFAEELLGWGANGLRQMLCAMPHPSFSKAVDDVAIPAAIRRDVYVNLAAYGDPFVCAAAIEVELQRSVGDGEVDQAFRTLITSFLHRREIGDADQFELMCSLIMVVDGELAYRRILRDKPPFWRRLAAVAQASMVAHIFASVGGELKELVQWCRTVRGRTFLMQSIIDMRVEPLWDPELLAPSQLLNEVGGRVQSRFQGDAETVVERGLQDLVGNDESLFSAVHAIRQFLPGPLEGSVVPGLELRAEDLASIQLDLTGTITLESFHHILMSAFFYRIPADLIALANDAIVRADFYLAVPESEENPVAIFFRLAHLAAVVRSPALADSICIALRVHRSFHPQTYELVHCLRIYLAACASRANLGDWAKCVGDRVAEVAFSDMTQEEASILHADVEMLLHLAPVLWPHCGPAKAALAARMKA